MTALAPMTSPGPHAGSRAHLAAAIILLACGLPADAADAPAAAKPFTPPALEEIERSATWIERPVRNAIEMLRAAQRDEKPLCTVAEALAAVNDSPAANARILSALGRLPEGNQANLGGRVERHIHADLGSTNPIMISTSAEFDVLGLTGFGLFTFDRSLEPFATASQVFS